MLHTACRVTRWSGWGLMLSSCARAATPCRNSVLSKSMPSNGLLCTRVGPLESGCSRSTANLSGVSEYSRCTASPNSQSSTARSSAGSWGQPRSRRYV
uniref:Putative secreted protein n=1 Tax=Ixodes ricinus TaxID=34613 RepID=A0A6B0UDR8_IXORI